MTPIRNRILVKLKDWDVDWIPAIAEQYGLVDLGMRVHLVCTVGYRVPDGTDADAAIAALRADPRVASAEFDKQIPVTRAGTMFGAPKDPLAANLWYLLRHGFYQAWKYTTGNPAIKVGISDSGFMSHPDIKPPDFPHGDDGTTNCDDKSAYTMWWDRIDSWFSHGSFCYGIMAALHNGSGVSGASPGCTFYAASQTAYGYQWKGSMMESINWMLTQDVHISSHSWGYPLTAKATWGMGFVRINEGADLDALCAQLASESLMFAAAMNTPCDVSYLERERTDGYDGYVYDSTGAIVPMTTPWHEQMIPARTSGVLAVGAIGESDDPSVWRVGSATDFLGAQSGSTFGHHVRLCAAGSWFYAPNYLEATGARGFIWDLGGTSYATPLVASGAALIWSVNPSLTKADVTSILTEEGDDFRSAWGRTAFPNAKVLNVHAGVLKALTTVSANAGNVYPYASFWGSVLTLDQFFRPPPDGSQSVTDSVGYGHSWLAEHSYLPSLRADGNFARGGPVYSGVVPSWPGSSVLTPDSTHQGFFTASGYTNDLPPQSATTLTGGTPILTLDGQVKCELRGYSSDPITSVELWCGATLVYSGPPTILTLTASSAGAPQTVKVKAFTANSSAEETYTDVIVSSLVLGASPDLAATAASMAMTAPTPSLSNVAAGSVVLQSVSTSAQVRTGAPTLVATGSVSLFAPALSAQMHAASAQAVIAAAAPFGAVHSRLARALDSATYGLHVWSKGLQRFQSVPLWVFGIGQAPTDFSGAVVSSAMQLFSGAPAARVDASAQVPWSSALMSAAAPVLRLDAVADAVGSSMQMAAASPSLSVSSPNDVSLQAPSSPAQLQAPSASLVLSADLSSPAAAMEMQPAPVSLVESFVAELVSASMELVAPAPSAIIDIAMSAPAASMEMANAGPNVSRAIWIWPSSMEMAVATSTFSVSASATGVAASMAMTAPSPTCSVAAPAGVTYLGVGAVSTGTSNTMDVALPSAPGGGWNDNDMLVLVFRKGNGGSPAVPSGWTSKYSNVNGFLVAYKRVSGTPTGATVTNGSGFENKAVIVAFRGVTASGDPFETYSSAQSSVSGSSAAPASITTTTDGCELLLVAGGEDVDSYSMALCSVSTVSGPSGNTQLASSSGRTGDQSVALYVSRADKAVHGSTGGTSVAFNVQGDGSFYQVGALLALKPA